MPKKSAKTKLKERQKAKFKKRSKSHERLPKQPVQDVGRSVSLDMNKLTEYNVEKLLKSPETEDVDLYSLDTTSLASSRKESTLKGNMNLDSKPKATIIGDSLEDIEEVMTNQKCEHKVKVLTALNKEIQSKVTRSIFYFRDPLKAEMYLRKLRALSSKHANADLCVIIIELLGTLMTVCDCLSLNSVVETIGSCMKTYPSSEVKQKGWRSLAFAAYKAGNKAMVNMMKEMEEVFILEHKNTYQQHPQMINGYIEKCQYEQKNEDINEIVSCIESYKFLLSLINLDEKEGKHLLDLYMKGIENIKHKQAKLAIAELILLLFDKEILLNGDKETVIEFFEEQTPHLKKKHNKTKDGRREWTDIKKTLQTKIPTQIESIKINKTKYYFDTHTNLARYNFVKILVKYAFQIHCLKNPTIQTILYIDEVTPKKHHVDDEDDDNGSNNLSSTAKTKNVSKRITEKKERQNNRKKDRKAKSNRLLWSNQ